MNADTTRTGKVPSVRTALVVDDEPHVAELIAGVLTAEGFAVTSAADGPAALRRARASQPDIVVLDVGLPGLDGFEVLEGLRANAATMHIPVIILTNYGEPELRERGMKLGALEFLVKADTNPAQLSESVERAIGPRALPSI